MGSFQELPLLDSLQQTLKEQALIRPTEIQWHAIPKLLQKKSLVGIAETGSGKTLAYVLPLLHLLKKQEMGGDAVSEESHPRALVLVPTRELGEQVSKVFKLFTHGTRLRVRSVLGGTDLQVAKENIKGPFEILVATPGRLVQMLGRRQVKLRDAGIVVLDEADQMVDSGFLTDATEILSHCPQVLQIALFSATVPEPVQKLIDEIFPGVEVYCTAGANRVVASLKTENKKILNGKRFPVLEELLKKKTEGGTLIFTNTREQCDKLADELEKNGYKCAVYRGEMDKIERRANLKAFRDGEIGVLVSTDLASRGLDVEHVGRVINYHMPQVLENYLHRAGRTARAGREGLVINFITERDEDILRLIRR